jgi:transposase
MKKTKNKYNHYTKDFRHEAVHQSVDPNTSAAEVAKELGIHPGQIDNWRRQYIRLSEIAIQWHERCRLFQQRVEELRKLKREIADLKAGNEFLKRQRRTFSKTSGEAPLY